MRKTHTLLHFHLVFVLLSSCSSGESGQSASVRPPRKMASEQWDTIETFVSDSVQLSKMELTNLYSKAIGDFMQVVYQKDNLVFDTLFLGERKFGTEDDFPEITLPNRIGSTRLLMVSVGEAHGAYKDRFKKTCPFINLMGWANKRDAEFIFICFYPEFKHQYDVYLNYVYEPLKNQFELEEERLEVLMDAKGNKAPHFAIYKQGKYLGDKALH